MSIFFIQQWTIQLLKVFLTIKKSDDHCLLSDSLIFMKYPLNDLVYFPWECPAKKLHLCLRTIYHKCTQNSFLKLIWNTLRKVLSEIFFVKVQFCFLFKRFNINIHCGFIPVIKKLGLHNFTNTPCYVPH